MSRYNDIDKLLEEIGTSARSASDPWTLSRNDLKTVRRGSFTPAVVGDMGAPLQDLSSEIQSSEKITNAAIAAAGPTGSSGSEGQSGSSGFLSGLFSFFPLASGIAKLFGLDGDSSSPPSLTPFELPPSISFEGAMTSTSSGITSLVYGQNGLPKTSSPTSNFTDAPAEVSMIAGQAESGLETVSRATAPATPAIEQAVSGNLMREFTALTNSSFATGSFGTTASAGSPGTFWGMPAASESMADTGSPYFAQGPDASFPSFAGGGADHGSTANAVNRGATGSQQGQNILVQVQAMDSQSFMDHSNDIAQAVRQALLNMNSLNDVILDL